MTAGKEPETFPDPKLLFHGVAAAEKEPRTFPDSNTFSMDCGSREGTRDIPRSQNTFSMGCGSREGTRGYSQTPAGHGALGGQGEGKGENQNQQHHRGRAKAQPSPGVTRGHFWFLFCYSGGRQGRTSPRGVPGSKNHRGLRTPTLGWGQGVEP